MFYIYLALGFVLFALVWRIGKYDDVPCRWRRPRKSVVVFVADRHERLLPGFWR
jgi:hypothetical protein